MWIPCTDFKVVCLTIQQKHHKIWKAKEDEDEQITYNICKESLLNGALKIIVLVEISLTGTKGSVCLYLWECKELKQLHCSGCYCSCHWQQCQPTLISKCSHNVIPGPQVSSCYLPNFPHTNTWHIQWMFRIISVVKCHYNKLKWTSKLYSLK